MPHRRASRKVISLIDNSLANDDEGIRPNRFIMKRYRPHTENGGIWRPLCTRVRLTRQLPYIMNWTKSRICVATASVVKIDCSKRLAFLLHDFKLISNQQQLISKTDTCPVDINDAILYSQAQKNTTLDR